MAFHFLYSWWHYSDKEAVAPAPRNPIPCEEEEEEDEDLCWSLGEMLLVYCLVVVVLKLGYLGVNRFRSKQPGGISCTWKIRSKGPQGCACRCHCHFTLCGLFRKLFGGKEDKEAGDPSSPPPVKDRLKKRLSLLSQQTFCDSNSSCSDSLDSQLSSWKWSQTGDSISVPSRKKRGPAKQTDPKTLRMGHQPCMRCKVKRTQEWLDQHFYNRDPPPPSEGY